MARGLAALLATQATQQAGARSRDMEHVREARETESVKPALRFAGVTAQIHGHFRAFSG